ncbi:DNA polymerase III subunit gamma/tau [Patescibacteria group bacterium]|nr:DNA polymerase III subunit gamma/tau [Patescibacteria group bacterium]
MSLAFYRKYRPNSFDHLIGQSAAKITLLEALKTGRISHAFLFAGPRGTGKTSTARLIAKAIQCESRKESGEPCLECDICQANGKGELIDLIEIDAASNRGIEDIRDLREKIRLAPTRAKSKVYIIDEVHMLTKEAFNALLKSLEEPPSHVFFILATTEIHKIPETIISRCQRYDFKRISDKDIVERLKFIAAKENLQFEFGALELIARYSEGGMRDAISLLEQFSNEKLTEELARERLGLTSHQSCDDLYGALGSFDTQKGLKIIESLHNDGYDLKQFTVTFLGLLRQKLHIAIKEEKKAIVPKILNWIEMFDSAWAKLKFSSIAQLPLEIAVIRATQSETVNVEKPVAKNEVKEPLVQVEQPKRQEKLMHLDALKQQLPAVYSALENPSIRLSFQTGNLKSMEGNLLKFAFTSAFHIEKVKAPEAVVAIENAFAKVLGTQYKIECELDSGRIVSEVTPEEELGWDVTYEKI